MDYKHKVKPYEHQAWVFEETRDRDAWGLFLEQRLGKSKVTVDTAAWLFGRGKIDALIVVAPNGVHRAWAYGDETAGDHPHGHVGDHCPDHVPYKTAYWRSAMRKRERDAIEALYEPGAFLRVMAFNIEALAKDKRGKLNKAATELKRMLTTFRCLLVVDESTCIKNLNGSTRAELVVDLSVYAAYKRLLSGEPAPEGPPDLWGQLVFLDPMPLGFTSYYAFRARYCDLEKRVFAHPKKPGSKIKTQQIVGYKRQAELAERLETLSTTLKRRDCGDMPAQVLVNRYVELTAEQQKAYKQLAEEWYYELQAVEGDELDEVEVERTLTRMLRFNQICGGFLPREDGSIYAFPTNPKLEALVTELAQLPRDAKVIVWARFVPELRAIVDRLREEYGHDAVVRYYGEVPDAERDAAKARFQHDPTCKVFVGNPKAGRYNLTLAAANDVLWYSWDHPLEDYIQANDRPVLPGKKDTINYSHLVAPGTFEAVSLNRLRQKQQVADAIRNPVDLKNILKGGA